MPDSINLLVQSRHLSNEASELVARFELFLPASLTYFEGHFDRLSLLPGVVQVHWAMELLQSVTDCGPFKSVERLKFVRPILPDSLVEVVLTYSPSLSFCSFEFSDNQGKFSSGKIVLGCSDD